MKIQNLFFFKNQKLCCFTGFIYGTRNILHEFFYIDICSHLAVASFHYAF